MGGRSSDRPDGAESVSREVGSQASVAGVRLSLWRAAVGFRVVAAVLCLGRIVRWRDIYAHPAPAWLVGAGIVVVTAAIAWLGLAGRAHRLAVVVPDLIVTVALTLVTVAAQTNDQRHGGMPTLTTVWAAGPVIEIGLITGWPGGLIAAVIQFAASVVVREGYDGNTLANGALLLIVGVVAGYLAVRTRRAEVTLAVAVAAAAAAAERERLGRSIHDGVLQVLGLVHRKGRAAGGDWARIGAEAATQEAALRALITRQAFARSSPTSLTAALAALRSERTTISVPDTEIDLDPDRAEEIVGIVRAALDNVDQHAGAGARAWVLLELVGDRLCLSVRDDGIGVAPERLAAAEAEGRLGVARSIRGRAAELGGTVRFAASREGTEIEIEVPVR